MKKTRAAKTSEKTKRAEQLVVDLMSIPGPSGQEAAVVDFIVEKLREAGAPAAALGTDQEIGRAHV